MSITHTNQIRQQKDEDPMDANFDDIIMTVLCGALQDGNSS